ncbi:MAG TPA: zf-HC2 domain-containing protein [Gemmatimonadota bacterium]|nr:zf-HC2 domain-containing protein [Gemmatimonadota bacterium]
MTDHVEELLDAWRTGELDPARSERVASHLEECAACRAELERLGPWTDTIARGFAARRTAARDLEPDWAAQRAAIVARTSGGARSGGGRRAFWRWAPQVALVALAALIVGIVWRENPREPHARRGTESLREAVEAPTAAKPDADDEGTERGADSALESREAEVVGRQAGQEPAAPPPSADAAAKAELEEAENDRRDALADRAAEPVGAAYADVGRFETAARSALAARDTTAARRALAFWADTLPPAERELPRRAALADSLVRLLDTGP